MTKLFDRLETMRRLPGGWTRSMVKMMFGGVRNYRSSNGARTPARNAEDKRKRKWKLEKIARRRNR